MKTEFICWLRGLPQHELDVERSNLRWVEFDGKQKVSFVLEADAPFPSYTKLTRFFSKHSWAYETHPTWGEVMVLEGKPTSKFLRRITSKWEDTCLAS